MYRTKSDGDWSAQHFFHLLSPSPPPQPCFRFRAQKQLLKITSRSFCVFSREKKLGWQMMCKKERKFMAWFSYRHRLSTIFVASLRALIDSEMGGKWCRRWRKSIFKAQRSRRKCDYEAVECHGDRGLEGVMNDAGSDFWMSGWWVRVEMIYENIREWNCWNATLNLIELIVEYSQMCLWNWCINIAFVKI